MAAFYHFNGAHVGNVARCCGDRGLAHRFGRYNTIFDCGNVFFTAGPCHRVRGVRGGQRRRQGLAVAD